MRKGRPKQHQQNLRPNGLTREQHKILEGLAEARDVPVAKVKRGIIADFLRLLGFSNDEQGLKDDD